MEGMDEPSDPTRIGDQPALTTARRRLWLVTAGVLAAVSIGVFVWTAPLGGGVSTAGIVIVVVLFAAMVVIAVQVAGARARNLAFAAVTLTMVAAVLALLLVQVAAQTAT
jgi:hypothetical protein